MRSKENRGREKQDTGAGIHDSVLLDLHFGIRTLVKNPVFTAISVLTLAVGIGANVAMFSTMNAVLVRPLPFPEPDRLVLGRTTFGGDMNPIGSAHDYYDHKERSNAFENFATILFGPFNSTITGFDEPERVATTLVSFDLFRTLGVNPQLGRHFIAEEGELQSPPVAIISHGYWQRRFGGVSDVTDRSLTMGGEPTAIVGVMPPGFEFMHDVDIWMPMQRGGRMANARRFHNWLYVGRLKPGVSLEQAQAQADVISAQLEAEYPESNDTKALLLTNLQEAMVEGYKTSLALLMSAVALVLLIACGNVAGLLLARGSTRRAELSVRAALGASRSRLTRQLLTESLVTALAAGVVGVLLAIWFQGMILQYLSMDIPGVSDAGISAPMLISAVAISFVTGVLFGVAPAISGARTNVVEDLKASGRTTDSGGARFRSGLVVVQVALSIILLVGSGLLIRSFARLRGVDPGFNTGNLLTAEIRLPQSEYGDPEQRVVFYSALAESVRALPGVTDVALINQLPIRNPGNNIYVYAADNPPVERSDLDIAYQRTVFPGYFEAMGIPLIAGRGIERSDRSDAPPVLVINQTMADTLFPGVNPIGRQVVVDFGESVTLDVVGVAGDVRVSGLAYRPRLAMYGSYYQRPYFTMSLAVRTAGDPTAVAGPLRMAVWDLDRNIPVAELETMGQVISRSMGERRVIVASLVLFAAVALFLAAIGLYGVLAYYVSRRVHEIGLRMALGASGGDVLGMVLKRGLILVAIGLILGITGALGTTRLIQDMLFQTETTDPITFVAVSLFFALVATIASLIPALKAIRVDPQIALQAD